MISIRKSFSIGKLAKITVSKSGISVSTGIPGVRFGINSKGQGSMRLGAGGLQFRKTKKVL